MSNTPSEEGQATVRLGEGDAGDLMRGLVEVAGRVQPQPLPF
ncbi:MAG: hypothetical protein WBF37_10590 [Dehalococcoidia bacterium]